MEKNRNIYDLVRYLKEKKDLGYTKPNFNEFLKVAEAVIFESFDITPSQLKSKSRKRNIVKMRQFFFKRAVEIFASKINLEGIASSLGKDHSTVNHAIKQFNNLFDSEKQYRLDYEKFYRLVEEKFSPRPHSISLKDALNLLNNLEEKVNANSIMKNEINKSLSAYFLTLDHFYEILEKSLNGQE